MVGTGSYSPWGVPDNGSVTLNGFGFTGEQVDPESGFVYLRNRYYDPTTSRFLTPDPLGFVGSGVNLYAYAGNNPATLTDPSGLTGPDGLSEHDATELMAIEMGILPEHGPQDLFSEESYGTGLPTTEESEIGGVLPAGAGAFGPAGEGGMYCPETDGPPPTTEGGGGQDARPIRGGSEEENGGRTGKVVTRPGMGLGPTGVHPPGYDPNTWTTGPSSRPSWAAAGQQSWFDPEGGEWSYDPGDRPGDPKGSYWDYKAPGSPNNPWQTIY